MRAGPSSISCNSLLRMHASSGASDINAGSKGSRSKPFHLVESAPWTFGKMRPNSDDAKDTRDTEYRKNHAECPPSELLKGFCASMAKRSLMWSNLLK